MVEAGFHEHGVDDRQARRRERRARDLRLAVVPAEAVVGQQPDDCERRQERDEPDRERRCPFPPELRDVDLRAGQERQHDARKGADEAQPARHVEAERVAEHESGKELDQRDREARLHRDHRREENCSREYCSYSDVAHADLYLLRSVVEAIGSGRAVDRGPHPVRQPTDSSRPPTSSGK